MARPCPGSVGKRPTTDESLPQALIQERLCVCQVSVTLTLGLYSLYANDMGHLTNTVRHPWTDLRAPFTPLPVRDPSSPIAPFYHTAADTLPLHLTFLPTMGSQTPRVGLLTRRFKGSTGIRPTSHHCLWR